MKKIIIGVVLILALAVVGAPFVNGLLMEKVVTHAKDNANEMYGTYGVGLEITKYDRGFSSSEIEWKVNLGQFAEPLGIKDIIIQEKAKHGLTGVVSETSLEKNPWFKDFIDKKLEGKNPLKVTTRYNLTGKIDSLITIAPFSLQIEGETFDFKPGKIASKSDTDFTHCAVDASLEGLSITGGPNTITIDSISMSSDMEKISTYIFAGTSSYEVEKIKTNGELENFELNKMLGKNTTSFDKDSNTFSSDVEINIGNINADGQTINDSHATISTNNIDVKGYEEFIESYMQTMQTILKAASNNNPEEMDSAMQQEMMAAQMQIAMAYEKLMKKGLEFKISDLHTQINGEAVTGDMDVQLKKDITFAQIAPVYMQPQLALDYISWESNLNIPAKLTGDNPMLVSPISPQMQTGMFVKEGENLVHHAKTEDGKLLLNGQEVILQ